MAQGQYGSASLAAQCVNKRCITCIIQECPAFQCCLGNVLFDDVEKMLPEVQTYCIQRAATNPVALLKRVSCDEFIDTLHLGLGMKLEKSEAGCAWHRHKSHKPSQPDRGRQ